MTSIFGVDRKNIANTVRALAAYLDEKNIGPTHNALAREWGKHGGLADRIDAMEQSDLAFLFGTGDSTGYRGDKFRPLLKQLQPALLFLAYKERLEGKKSTAKKLIGEIDTFLGFKVGLHITRDDLEQEIKQYINASKRHPSEKYDDPKKLINDDGERGEDLVHAQLHNLWLPDGEEWIEARLEGYGGRPDNADLQWAKGVLEYYLSRKGIEAEVSVILGKTYGEDIVVVRMSAIQYIERYVPRAQQVRFDHFYQSYMPGEASFFGPGDAPRSVALYVREDKIGLVRNHPHMTWLNRVRLVRETRKTLNTVDGEESFIRLTPENIEIKPPTPDASTEETQPWDLGHQLNRVLCDLFAYVRGDSPDGTIKFPDPHPAGTLHPELR